mmetsp:Transcript_24737/g.32303  ORF Transcript_24737/g.32303 Transcript_24737/m.32303 type:complete len:420 (-) Transcript_24737:475-1734(-)
MEGHRPDLKSKNNIHPSLDQALVDVETRFILNLPDAELSSSDRLFFQIEQAHWFYEDFYADTFAHLPHFRLLKSFASHLFDHCPLLQPYQSMYSTLFEDFHSYKGKVPVSGTILLNPNRSKFVLVKGWKGSTWSFPRGKTNHTESSIDCAARETFEECGFDCKSQLSEQNAITMYANGQRITMYIAFDVSENNYLEPIARKEVSQCGWFSFENLPKTYAVLPFVSRLRRFLEKEFGRNESGRSSSTPRSSRARKDEISSNRSNSVPRLKSKNWDQSNDDTFGDSKSQRWSVEDMFATNEKLTGKSFIYDGNNHSFGEKIPCPPKRPSRKHVAEEADGKNSQTFGASESKWTVEDMFNVNEKLTGRVFLYDGNPQSFGCNSSSSKVEGCGLSSQQSILPMMSQQVLTKFSFNSREIMACF